MDSAAVVQLLESNPPELIQSLNAELLTNLGTSHYHRLTPQELNQRHSHVFRSLCQWLLSRDEKTLQQTGEDLGKLRFREGTPLGQMVLVVILFEKHLLQFLDASGQQLDEDVRHAVTDFFQRFVYRISKGFETALAFSGRSGTPAGSEAQQPRKVAAPAGQEPEEMGISRGGQVGEVGG